MFTSTPSLDDIVNAQHAAIDLVDVPHTKAVEQKMRGLNISFRNSVNLPSFHVVPELIANTPLVTIIHQRFAEKHARRLSLATAELPTELQKVFKIYFCAFFHPTRKTDPGLIWLLKMISDQASRIAKL